MPGSPPATASTGFVAKGFGPTRTRRHGARDTPAASAVPAWIQGRTAFAPSKESVSGLRFRLRLCGDDGQRSIRREENMKELRDLVGSVHHLAVFETAAHHESFTHAARELSVTQPAVSRSVRDLETALGVNLFRRGHRSVTLTEEGKLLYHSVSAGFERMLETARQLHRRTRESHVTVITSSAFANYWMLPRLSDFHRRHRDASNSGFRSPTGTRI